MAERIGLIQSGGIGDIIIALPIADFLIERGREVVWPIYERFVEPFRAAKPAVRFIGVPENSDGYYNKPLEVLQQNGCDRVFSLYCFMQGHDETLAKYLKFDEYKYAVVNVPFAQKWNLKIARNTAREQALFERLHITRPYICTHLKGSRFEVNLPMPPEWERDFQIVPVTELTENPLDWLYTLEHASKLVLLDSCFANLAEQLHFPNEKYLILRTPGPSTPVFGNSWRRFVLETRDGVQQARLI